MVQVGIIMGSDSDLPVMSEAAKVLDSFGIEYELTIVSAHRTPDKMYEYASTAQERGLKVIIAGMTAAITTLPVIGVPVKTRALSGVDSLYSIVQMPGGIPVATVAINGAKNAGLLTVQMLAAFDPQLQEKVKTYKRDLKNSVEEKAEKLENIGYTDYLSQM